MEKIQGTAWRFGDHVNADIAIGYNAAVGKLTDPKAAAALCMVGYAPDFPRLVRPGDFIVAGRNFACGNLHPQFNLAIKGAGVGAIIAHSFSRGFYRSGFYEGIICLECAEPLEKIAAGDRLEIDVKTGLILNLTSGNQLQASAIPESLLELVHAGGLVPYLRMRFHKTGRLCQSAT
jgi:3-isopropylmalate/(R)-2-methylmalate dehydratase small subunit